MENWNRYLGHSKFAPIRIDPASKQLQIMKIISINAGLPREIFHEGRMIQDRHFQNLHHGARPREVILLRVSVDGSHKINGRPSHRRSFNPNLHPLQDVLRWPKEKHRPEHYP